MTTITAPPYLFHHLGIFVISRRKRRQKWFQTLNSPLGGNETTQKTKITKSRLTLVELSELVQEYPRLVQGITHLLTVLTNPTFQNSKYLLTETICIQSEDISLGFLYLNYEVAQELSLSEWGKD